VDQGAILSRFVREPIGAVTSSVCLIVCDPPVTSWATTRGKSEEPAHRRPWMKTNGSSSPGKSRYRRCAPGPSPLLFAARQVLIQARIVREQPCSLWLLRWHHRRRES
jgi:hypothetical protein